jgi:hypothetical protein
MRPDVVVVGHVNAEFEGNSLVGKVVVRLKFFAPKHSMMDDLCVREFGLQADRLLRFTSIGDKTLDGSYVDVLQFVGVEIDDRLEFIKDDAVT